MTNNAQQVTLTNGAAVDNNTISATLTDEQLIALAVADRHPCGWAFSELWHRHCPYVRAFCARRLGGHAEAEDVTQNVALKTWSALAQFGYRSRFRTWLTAIAITQCAEYRRREARQKDIALKWYAQGHECFAASVSLDNDDHALLAFDTRRALNSLSPRAREVLVMRFYRELSLEEMGKELNVGLSAVKMRLYRSINRLRANYLDSRAIDTPF